MFLRQMTTKSIYIQSIYIVKGVFCTFLRFILRLWYGYPTARVGIWLVSGVEREGGGAEVVTLLVYIPAFNA